MKSLQHVLWRGALALSLMAVGIGGGLGMPAAESPAASNSGICTSETRMLLADAPAGPARADRASLTVLRRPLTPAS